ncbi:MAG: putative molybdenum carrier protein [gamma proteobacterium symbiont of Taylorina sp.]|nr:putative molybdenum carrier protein [gamma proteobacterium symbiont of Taylorina sp.]
MVKIVLGGQTGVDRAALDAVLECGIDAGGEPRAYDYAKALIKAVILNCPN